MHNHTKLLFLGDVFLKNYCTINLSKDYFIIFNLEAPISNSGTPIPEKINLISKKEILHKVFNPSSIAVSLSNNHIMDYGNQAFEETINYLLKNNIKFFGAGKISENYNNPLIIDFHKLQLALLGYCYANYYDQIKKTKGLIYGPAPLEEKRIIKDINHIKNKVDKIIISLHWGIEESNLPNRSQIILARKIIDAGADCIIGHHAHTIQPVERYKGRLIAYGLGNFIFPDLDVPAHFNHHGHPRYHYRKKQQIWNRASIGIEWNPNNNNYKILPFYFKKNHILLKKTFFHRYAYLELNKKIDKLEIMIKKNLKYKKIYILIIDFLSNPRLPKLNSIKNIIKILAN